MNELVDRVFIEYVISWIITDLSQKSAVEYSEYSTPEAEVLAPDSESLPEEPPADDASSWLLRLLLCLPLGEDDECSELHLWSFRP